MDLQGVKRFRVILLGDSSVGKTSMIRRACDADYNPKEQEITTIGVDFRRREEIVGDERIGLLISDPSGQERFRAVARTYIRGSNVAILGDF